MIKYDWNFEPFLKNETKYFNTFASTSLKDYFEKSSQYKDIQKQLQFAGFDKEELSISYENDYLTVEGKSVMLDTDYSKRYYIPAKYYDINNINVKFEKCILTIECKIKTNTETVLKQIKIK